MYVCTISICIYSGLLGLCVCRLNRSATQYKQQVHLPLLTRHRIFIIIRTKRSQNHPTYHHNKSGLRRSCRPFKLKILLRREACSPLVRGLRYIKEVTERLDGVLASITGPLIILPIQTSITQPLTTLLSNNIIMSAQSDDKGIRAHAECRNATRMSYLSAVKLWRLLDLWALLN
jgi:hypothetical protein